MVEPILYPDGTQRVEPEGTKFGDWRDQLGDDLKKNEIFTSFKGTLSDFAKSHVDTLGKVKDFEGRVANSIPKLSDKATDAEKVAYRKALGVPNKPEEYEFPVREGKENNPQMVGWAQKVFHRHGVPKEAAKGIGAEWNQFMDDMVEAEEKIAETEKVEAQTKFRGQFKSEEEYKAGYELTKRFWNKVTGTNFDEVYKEPDAWQVPLFMSFIFNTAKMMGEDVSPKGRSPGDTKTEGMVYDKSPAPPKT